MVPSPPISDVPPITAEAIASSSAFWPAEVVAAFSREVEKMPAIAVMSPMIMKSAKVCLGTLMPESFAASGLPPIA